MKIMVVVNEFPPEKIAGTAMATQAMAEHLTQRGHQVCVVVTTSCPLDVQDKIIVKGYELVWLQPRPMRGLGSLWRIWKTFTEAKRFKPDVIQGQAVSCGLVAAVVGRMLGVPSICYAQGYDVYQATWLQKKTEIRWGCSWPNHLLAVTQDLADSIQRVVALSPIEILPHAFELPELTETRDEIRQRFHLQANETLVFCVGRLETFKGHDVLLHAWGKCLAVHPQAKLWIAGIGSEKETLLQLATELGIEDSVKFVGYLSKDEVHQHMEAADLFVLPSRSEPFGIVLLEAMAHGLPVVASAVGGIPEVVPKVGDVELVPVEDVDSLSKAIEKSLADNLRPSMDNRAHALQFEWSHQVKRFETIYETLIH